MCSSDTPSMLRLLEAIRQENKREREEIKARLARIESMVGQVLERDAAAAAAACASGMSTPMANREANVSLGLMHARNGTLEMESFFRLSHKCLTV